MSVVSRRVFLKMTGAAAAGGAAPACTTPPAVAPQTMGQERPSAREPGTAVPPRANPYAFFQPGEAAFIEAAVERLIPADELGPGALGAGVPNYIDRQLAGAWGAGERLYRSGPWQPGKPTQGYQLPYTPAELFRQALRSITDELRKMAPNGFGQLSAADQDAYLKALEGGERKLNEVPSGVFFASLLEMTIEGYFADPVYGGNRDMVGWKLVGFPGAYANYYELVDKHGIAFVRPPVSLAQDAAGSIHVHPVIQVHPLSKGK
ncbi:MAG: gluconate 2-dehydrogenase subunit 3 family protein [Burkholderiaceae bacterium]